MRTARLTVLRRAPDLDPPGAKAYQGHYRGCPAEAHVHWLLGPWPEAAGPTNLSTQAAFALREHRDLARNWNNPWYLTVMV